VFFSNKSLNCRCDQLLLFLAYFFHGVFAVSFCMVMPVVTSIDGTTLLKYSFKPVLRIAIYNYETCWITQRKSWSSVCHFRITVRRLRVRITVRWLIIPIYIFLGFPKDLRVNYGIVFNLSKDHFPQFPFKVIIYLYTYGCTSWWWAIDNARNM